MKKTDTFTHPLPGFGGQYNTPSWAGYQHLQPRLPENRPDLRHIGDDYNGPGAGNSDEGLRVEAMAPGIVEKVIRWNGNYGFGNHVFIRHELTPQLRAAIKKWCGVDTDILYTHYAHMKEIFTPEGMEVDKGQLIGTVGKTGTTWSHLHSDVRKPTGKGYESYPSGINEKWVEDYYISPFLLAVNFNNIDQYIPKPEPEPTPVPPTPPAPPPVIGPTPADIQKAKDFIVLAEQSLSEAKKLLQ